MVSGKRIVQLMACGGTPLLCGFLGYMRMMVLTFVLLGTYAIRVVVRKAKLPEVADADLPFAFRIDKMA